MTVESTQIKRIESDVHDMREDVSDLKIRVAVAESNINEIKDNMDSIKGNTTWLLRLMVGGIVGGVLTYILKNGLTF